MKRETKSRRWGSEKKWFSTSEAARYLGISVDTIRQLDERGELRASRTKGSHRRFSRKALDAHLTSKARRGIQRLTERPNHRSRPIARDAPPAEPVDEEFEPGEEEFEQFSEAPPAPPPDPAETLVREMAEQKKRDEAEALLHRLATLKQYGLNQIGWGVPDTWHARVAAALESYVTLKMFPSWVSNIDAHRIVRGKVEELLLPYREETNRKKAEQAAKEEEAARKRREHEAGARDERRIQELIDDGMRFARSETLFDWESGDRARALRDVERMLKDSVEADWTEQDLKDAVDDELDEWEDDSPDGDEEDES